MYIISIRGAQRSNITWTSCAMRIQHLYTHARDRQAVAGRLFKYIRKRNSGFG